jgi:integrase/recombinase XerD
MGRSDQSFDQALSDYITYISVEKNYSKHTIEAYHRHLKLMILSLGGPDKLITTRSLTLQRIRKYLLSYFKNNKSLSFKTQTLSAIKQFLKYLFHQGTLTQDHSQALELPKTVKRLPTVLSENQVFGLMDAPDIRTPIGLRDRALLEALYGTGMRISEAIGLNLSQLSFESGQVHVMGKRSKERIIPLTDRTLFWLKTYLTEVRNPLWAVKRELPFIFLSTGGRHLSRVHAWRIVQKYAAIVGIKKCSPHVLRHAFASHLVNHGADLRSIQTLLGHQSLQSTEIYTHVGPKHLKDLIDNYHLLGK